MVMPIAEGLVEGDGLEGGGAANDGAGPAAAWAGVGTGLWAADSQAQRKNSKVNVAVQCIILRVGLWAAEFLDSKAISQTAHRAFLHPAAGS